jgi:hypothetical protein
MKPIRRSRKKAPEAEAPVVLNEAADLEHFAAAPEGSAAAMLETEQEPSI